MEIFYPSDDLEVAVQLAAIFLWAFAARFGWRFADFFLSKIHELLDLLFLSRDKR